MGRARGRELRQITHKENDIYVAQCPEVGTASQGYTIEEALANLKEATELYLEDFPCNILRQASITLEEFMENL
jgi:predicted RNase H-like HicB family nuclease